MKQQNDKNSLREWMPFLIGVGWSLLGYVGAFAALAPFMMLTSGTPSLGKIFFLLLLALAGGALLVLPAILGNVTKFTTALLLIMGNALVMLVIVAAVWQHLSGFIETIICFVPYLLPIVTGIIYASLSTPEG